MKKNIAVLIVFLTLNLPAFAKSEQIKFIYLHGTSHNSEESRQDFINKADNLHKEVKLAFDEDKLIAETFLKNGLYEISDKPGYFYWGDKPGEAAQHFDINLFLTKSKAAIGQLIRTKIVAVLHDAIWLEHDQNINNILNLLYQNANGELNDENSGIVLLGHSAGSLIVYQFLLNRVSYLDAKETFIQAMVYNPDLEIGPNSTKTCVQAFIASGLAIYDENHLVMASPALSDNVFFANGLKLLDQRTLDLCLPINKLKGIVTFGSPIAVFFSEVKIEGSQQRNMITKLITALIENGVFWLHVNHFDDAIGIAINDAFANSSVEKLQNSDIAEYGFMKNNNSKKRGANFINAHSWYWNKPKSFAKLLVEMYGSGYNEFVLPHKKVDLK